MGVSNGPSGRAASLTGSLLKSDNFGLFAAILVVAVFIAALVVLQKKPCEPPIEYRIGWIDPEFGLNEAYVRSEVERANAIWSKSIGHDLFRFNANADLVINLVYDWRQKATDSEALAADAIKQMSSASAEIKAELQVLSPAFEARKRRYDVQLEDYNRQVSYWNALGGASDYVVQSINDRAANLERERALLNQQSGQLHQLVSRYNSMVDQIKIKVASINSDGLAGTEFQKGVYSHGGGGNHIDVYQFEHESDLILVLAHELGHVLGLHHSANPVSIMSPVLHTMDLRPSQDDLRELNEVCTL